MNKIKIAFCDREFELEITYDVFEDELLLKGQIDTLDEFLNISNEDRDKLFEKVKQEIIKYIYENNKDDLNEEKIENIFKYIIPTEIYIERNEDVHIVDILCEYKFDMEHGLAIQFENEEFKKIVSQDEVL